MDMQPNIGKLDATIRYTVCIVLLAIVFLVDGPWHWAGLLGIIPIATAAIYWCPVWKLFGINTREGSGHGPASHVH